MNKAILFLILCFVTQNISAQTWTLPKYSSGYHVQPAVVYPAVVNPAPFCHCSNVYCLQTHRRCRENKAAEQLGRAIGGLISELVTPKRKRKKRIRKKKRCRRSYSY